MVDWIINEAQGWFYVIVGVILLGLCFFFIDLMEQAGKAFIRMFRD